MDIDPEVTARATAGLDAAGYGDRVVVVTADAEHGVPAHADYDAVVVTGRGVGYRPSVAGAADR